MPESNTKSLRRNTIVFLIGLTAAIFLSSCGSKEGPVAPWLGKREGQGSDPLFIAVDSVAAETTFAHTVTLGGGGVLFVGNDGGYEARSLVRFSVTDSSWIELKESRLILTLHSSQEFEPIRFLLHRVAEFWIESQVTWERAQTDTTGDVAWTNGGGMLFPLPVASAGPCSLQADTVRVAFDIPTEITKQVFASGVDDYGFLISLESEGLAHAIWRFHSREDAVALRPRWEVGLIDTSGNDTTIVLYAATDAAIANRVSALDENRLLVGSGVGYRSLIKLTLPEILDSTMTINRAELRLHCDTENMFLETKSMQVQLVDSIWRGDSTEVLGGYIDQALAVPGESSLNFNITIAVREWVTGGVENHGLLLRFSAETNAIAYCPVFSSYETGDFAPRLDIHYTIPPAPPQDQAPEIPDPSNQPVERT